MGFIESLMKVVHPSKLNIARTELEIRCPYCGDSIKHFNKGHLYLTTSPPYLYRCVKCETSGYVDAKFLHDIGCYDNDTLLDLLSENRIHRQQNRDNNNIVIKKKEHDLILPEVSESKQTIDAVNYFNSRYESNFDAETIKSKFKAILDIDAFVTDNRLDIHTKYFDLRQAIGFLSSDKTYGIFRDIYGNQPVRYYNLQLVPNDYPRSKSYTIAEPVDLMIDEINLIMTEGIFDIICVYNKYYLNSETYNNIFVATCGKSYATAINKYLSMGFLNLNIIIYSDADVDYKWYIEKVKKQIPLLANSKITIYYNTLGKDFGVPARCIETRKVVI